jgi:hypothetical protein
MVIFQFLPDLMKASMFLFTYGRDSRTSIKQCSSCNVENLDRDFIRLSYHWRFLVVSCQGWCILLMYVSWLTIFLIIVRSPFVVRNHSTSCWNVTSLSTSVAHKFIVLLVCSLRMFRLVMQCMWNWYGSYFCFTAVQIFFSNMSFYGQGHCNLYVVRAHTATSVFVLQKILSLSQFWFHFLLFHRMLNKIVKWQK